MRIIPDYLQYYSVVKSIKGLNTVSPSAFTGDSVSDVNVLKGTVDKRLNINGVDPLKGNQLVIEPMSSNKYKVKLKYQVVKPLIYNLNLIFDFDHTEEVVIGSES